MLDVLVGIPSYNEAQTIATVVRRVDAGLAAAFGPARCLIACFDNASPDGTCAAFDAVDTACPTCYRSTPPGVRGKGHNVLGLLALADQLDARVLVLLDADSTTLTPAWACDLAAPVIAGEAEFVAGRYETGQGGHLQNLVAIPFAYGVFGADVEQPVGGEFAFSRELVRHLAYTLPALELPASAHRYGIDIVLTAEAVVHGARHASAELGIKRHRPRPWDTVLPLVRDVIDSALYQAWRHRDALRCVRQPVPNVYATPPRDVRLLRRRMTDAERLGLRTALRAGLSAGRELYLAELGAAWLEVLEFDANRHAPAGLSADQWCEALYRLTARAVRRPTERDPCVDAIMALYAARLLAYARFLDCSSDALLARFLSDDRTRFFERRGVALGDPAMAG